MIKKGTKSKKVDEIFYKDSDYFVNSESMKVFEKFNLKSDFLSFNLSEWPQDRTFLKILNVFSKLKVVSDCAKRAVKLLQDHEGFFTTDPEQNEFILQFIHDNRKHFPTLSKNVNLLKNKSS